METYRLFFLSNSGRIQQALEFECAGDEAALAAIESHRDGRALELWNLDRPVAAFPAGLQRGAL